ncbi:hypothetical protein M569_00607, partial [Genlisea aurea]
KSRILIIGVTGNIGFELARESLKASHPTFGLVRDSSLSDQTKLQKLRFLRDEGIQILEARCFGSLQDEDALIAALKRADVVISAVSSKQILDQKLLIHAIKRAGCIKRFYPSEFGSDPDRTRVSELDRGFYSRKAEIRRLIEEERIPYTYICCNFYMSYLLPSLVQPRDGKLTVFGDGNAKAVFMKESDVAAFTISTVDDPRLLNGALHLRPSENTVSMIDLANLWEIKTGTAMTRNHVTEEQLLARIHETPYPENMDLVFIYSAFVKGDQTYFPTNGFEGTEAYPDINYTTVSQYLDTL